MTLINPRKFKIPILALAEYEIIASTDRAIKIKKRKDKDPKVQSSKKIFQKYRVVTTTKARREK